MRDFLRLSALFLIFTSACLAEPERRTVGFIGSFTGPAQLYGQACKNGFELALSERPSNNLKVLYEDDGFVPARTVSAFHKLAAENTDIIVTVGSTPSNAAAPLAQARGIPLVGWASDRGVSRNRPLVVRSYPSGFDEGKRAAEEAGRRKFENIAVMTSLNDYAESWREGVAAALPAASLIFAEQLTEDLKDYRALIAKTRHKGARSYLLCLNPGQSGLFAKQAAQLGGGARFAGCEYLHDRTELEASGGALKGSWFTTVPIQDEFRRRYRERFKDESIISGAANHYDLACMLMKIPPEKKGGELVRALLELGPQQGAVGEFEVKERDGDRFFDIPLTIREVD